jgi:hypothetical protein
MTSTLVKKEDKTFTTTACNLQASIVPNTYFV